MPNRGIVIDTKVRSDSEGPYAEIDHRLNALESHPELFEWRLDGWSIWPVVRFMVVSELTGRRIARGSRSLVKPWSYLRTQIPYVIKDLLSFPRIKQKKFFIFTHDICRSETVNGIAKDIYFDDLILHLKDCFKLENITNPRFSRSRNKAMVAPNITSSAIMLSSLAMTRFTIPASIRRISEELIEFLTRELDLRSISKNQIARRLNQFVLRKRLYRIILSRANPCQMLMVTAYMNHDIVAAAKELGIKIVELQHGFLNRYHPGYSWTESALPYKSTMPISDRIFLYGSYWKDELLNKRFWSDGQLAVVGSPRMDEHRDRGSFNPDGCLNLVLTTQGVDTPGLLAFMKRFMDLAEVDNLQLKLMIKMHPGESDKGPYMTTFGHYENVEILAGDDEPSTFELIAGADFHLSISSTCHYESLGLNVPSIILPFWSHQKVTHLCDTGYVFVAPSPEELLKLLLVYDEQRVPDSVSDSFFHRYAIRNILRELAIY